MVAGGFLQPDVPGNNVAGFGRGPRTAKQLAL
jgi:hypothetical protein